MKSRLLSLAVALGAGLLGVSAHAADLNTYADQRTKTEITPLLQDQPLAEQIAANPGKVFEVEGTVYALVNEANVQGYVLQIDPQQNVIIDADQVTPDLTVGKHLRVLARAPQQGSALIQIAEEALPAGVTQAASAPAKLIADVSKPAKVGGKKLAKAVAAAPVSDAVATFAAKIRQFNASVNVATATQIATQVLAKSEKYGVDPRLVFALLAQESRFNPQAVSPVGAQGLGQLMPGTAAGLGVKNPFDIAQNVDGTIRYLSGLLDQFGDTKIALAAYNAGPGNVRKYGGVPPFRETQHYVRTIGTHYQQLTESLFL